MGVLEQFIEYTYYHLRVAIIVAMCFLAISIVQAILGLMFNFFAGINKDDSGRLAKLAQINYLGSIATFLSTIAVFIVYLFVVFMKNNFKFPSS